MAVLPTPCPVSRRTSSILSMETSPALVCVRRLLPLTSVSASAAGTATVGYGVVVNLALVLCKTKKNVCANWTRSVARQLIPILIGLLIRRV